MKRITIEEAERIPQRLSIRNSINKINSSKCNQIQPGWKHYDHHCVKTWRIIKRFINKYIGRQYDVCYSDFLHWIRSERIFSNKKSQASMIWQFKEYFANFEPNTNYRQFTEYGIDENGVIYKQEQESYRKKSKVYKQYIYTLKYDAKDELIQHYAYFSEFHRMFGDKIFSKAKTGLTEKEYQDVVTQAIARGESKYCGSYFQKTPVGEPIEDPREISKAIYENRDRQRKYKRESDRFVKETTNATLGDILASNNNKYLKRLRKERDKAKAKEEQEFNEIERDRLGFDETSFKTPQKFNK